MLSTAAATAADPPAPLSRRDRLRRRVALLLAGLLGLLIAAAVLGLQLALGGPAHLLGVLAALLALALLLGALLAGAWLIEQEGAARRSEARAREQQLALRRERDAALAASAAKTRFLAQLSHELRVPLQAVAGFSQLLQMAPPGGPTPPRWAEAIGEAAAHMQALTDDLFDIARIESGALALKARPLALRPLLAEVLRLLEPQAEAAGARLLVSCSEDGRACVHADPLRLRQVLLNLLGNAIKYGRPGDPVRVEVERDAGEAGTLLLRVVDRGIGMDAQQLARLFEPFNRLGREQGPVPGSGVGLALARQLVLLMGGEIRVESQPGIGTTVHLRLPVPAAGGETTTKG